MSGIFAMHRRTRRNKRRGFATVGIVLAASFFVYFSFGGAFITSNFIEASKLFQKNLAGFASNELLRSAGRGSRETLFLGRGGAFQGAAGERIPMKTIEKGRSSDKLKHDAFQSMAFLSSEKISAFYASVADSQEKGIREMEDDFANLYSGWSVAGGAFLVPKTGAQLDMNYASPAIPAFPDGEAAARAFWLEHSVSLVGGDSPVTFDKLVERGK